MYALFFVAYRIGMMIETRAWQEIGPVCSLGRRLAEAVGRDVLEKLEKAEALIGVGRWEQARRRVLRLAFWARRRAWEADNPRWFWLLNGSGMIVGKAMQYLGGGLIVSYSALDGAAWIAGGKRKAPRYWCDGLSVGQIWRRDSVCLVLGKLEEKREQNPIPS